MLINKIDEQILKTRVKERITEDLRSPYYRDATAIIHSSPFRRLKHKTQVFYAPSNDHICTRMEHVLHVATISVSICKALGLDDDLAWAIGLGHDLGHTPFGHSGERIISAMMQKAGYDGFEHEVYSLRVVTFLSPLNLTYAVRDGIVSHCGEHFTRTVEPDFRIKDLDNIVSKNGIMPSTYEGCVVRLSDQIAYLGRDFEDATRLGIINPKMQPEICRKVLGCTNGEIINTLVEDIIRTAQRQGIIGFSDDVFDAVLKMKDFNYKNIYKSDVLSGYEKYFSRLISLIYEYLNNLFEKNGFSQDAYQSEGNMLAAGFFNYISEKKQSYIEHDGGYRSVVFDYISGMSDNFCLDCASEILRPEHLNQSIEKSLTGKWFDVR